MAIYRSAALARTAKADAYADLYDSTTFTIEIRSGALGATVDGSDVGVVLATFTGPTAPAFGSAVDDGTVAAVTAGAVASVTAAATGTAAHFREKRGSTIVGDGDVGIAGSGATCIISTTAIVAGEPVALLDFVVSQP